jgi:DNA-binding SARP family transcriptional activator
MEYLALGPLEVRNHGKPLLLRGSKQRGLLAVLLIHANKIVSRDHLIDELWGEHPPASARSSLHNQVFGLRKLLHASGEVLVADRLGYGLRVAPGELDVECFDLLLDRGLQANRAGTPAAAAETLRQALRLCRGTPYQCVANEPFAQAEINRVEERRLTALEERVAADLALGRHYELVGELYALVREHPRRERLCEELMIALYRGGRQADALQAYRAARERLVTDLGIEPGPTLRRLQQAILRHEPTLGPAPVRAGRRPVLDEARTRPRRKGRARWPCQSSRSLNRS